MKKTVQDLMSTNVHFVRPWETLDRAAELMWENDCGCVPVVNESNRLCGMLTDRDVCMAAYTQGRRLGEILVGSVSSKELYAVAPETTLDEAEALMRRQRVRRLPVQNSHGTVIGVLSIADLAGHLDLMARAGKPDGLSPLSMAVTLEAVSEPRATHPNEC